MMKVLMPTAIKGEKKSQDLSFPVIQTLGVNDTRCVGSILCEQGDRVHVRLSQFSRFSPLVAPTFGDFKIKTHAFWVPERIIWTHNLEYLNDSLDASFDEIKQPVNFSLRELYNAFIQEGLLVQKATFSTSPDNYAKKGNGKPQYDVNFFDFATDVGISYNFSAHGRMVFSSLQALGYALPLFGIIIDSSDYSDSKYYKFWNDSVYSIYPMLAFLRVFYDWIYPSQYVTQQGLGVFFTDDFVKEWSLDESYRIQFLMQAFTLMFNPYDKSFWTSLWAKPNQVAQNTPGGRGLSNLGSVYANKSNNGTTILNVDSISSSSPGYLEDVQLNQIDNTYPTTLTANALKWLEAVSDMVLRTNIGGTRVREFLKSHFGFVPSDVQSNVSTWLRTFVDRVQIQDVTNMSSTSSVLGEQGGKAISSGNGSLKFEASEKGYLIFVSQVVPAVGYYQGVAKECRAIKSRFDLYLPDFDSVSMEAVPRRALFNQYRDYEDFEKIEVDSLDDVLGYSPRDAERKIKRAVLSGDFLFNSRNTGLESYHTFRDVLYNRNNLAIDARFLEADNQTQRIFAYMGEDVDSGMYAQYDKIFNEMYFEVTKFSMMKSLSQSLPFFDEDGKRVNVDYEGQYV